MENGTIQRAAAVALSPDEAEERGKHCYELDQEFRAALREGRAAMWRAARAAHQLDEENGWTALGYETQAEYLADPEIGQSRSQFFRLVSLYREFVVQRKLPMATVEELDYTKADIVLPKVKAGSVKLTEAIDDVKALGARDLRDKYFERKSPDVGTRAPSDDDYVAPPPNPTDDTPQWAGSGPQEAADDVVEGDVIDAESESQEDAEFRGEAHPAHNGHHALSGQLQVAVVRAREALAVPLRQGPQRRLSLDAVKQQRAALEALVEALEA